MQLRIRQLTAKQRELCLVTLQLRFRLRDVFLARSCHLQIESLAIHGALRFGYIQCGAGAIEILPADGPAGRTARELDEPVILLAGVGGVRLSRQHVGPPLGNLFRPAAGVQTIDDLLSGGDIRLRLGDLWLDTRWIESRHHLAQFDVIALLDQHFRNALSRVERQIRLAQVHVAVQHDGLRALVAVGHPPHPRQRGYEHAGQQNPTGLRHRAFLPRPWRVFPGLT